MSISYGELDQYEGHWVCDETTGDEGFLDEHEDIFSMYDEDQCYWMKYPFQGRSLRKGGKSKGGGKGKQGKSKGKGAPARRFFRPYRKGGGKGKKSGKRHAYLLMRQGLPEDRVELLPDSSTFNFANGLKALAREKCRIWFSYEPPLFTDFSIIDEVKVPFLMSLPQMKNLGVSLDLRGTPEKILFHTGFLKGQGVPLHRNRASHLTLDVNEICRKAKLSADKGRQLHAASSFPAVADEPSVIPIHDPLQPIAAEPAIPPPATEKKYRLPAGQKVPPAQLHQRTAERNKVEVRGPEEQGAEPAAVPPPPVHPVPAKRCA